MKFLLFGTGDYYCRYKKWFVYHEIVALLDNSPQKQHTTLDGVEVLSPEDGIRLDYDKIVILSFYVKQMKDQLFSLGVTEDRIIHFYDLHQWIMWKTEPRKIQYDLDAEIIIGTEEHTVPRILLLSNELTLGGPPIALFHAALVLIKRGYRVLYASMIDGPLREILVKNEIPAVIDENLQLARMREVEWVRSFDLIVCNTLNFHVFLSERDLSIPIIWWLHDARFFYDGVRKEVIGKIDRRNLKVVSVGPVPEKAIHEFLPDIKCSELLYGVSDMGAQEIKKIDDMVVRFITIGFLEDIKGQDLLIRAVKKLPDMVRSKCEFYIVGYNDTLFGKKLQEESADLKEIIFTGSVDRRRIHELLDMADLLICPSRQDSMPTVAAEAMMHSVPCLVSDVTGTAAYIQDKVDGLIFQNGDVEELSEKIIWCFTHYQELSKMGNCARKVYEAYFSMKIFERNLLSVIDDSLNIFRLDGYKTGGQERNHV